MFNINTIKRGSFNVVTDLSWGSCGKGLAATYLANNDRPENIGTTNLPNAGHTGVILEDGHEYKFISKSIPTSAMLNMPKNGYTPRLWIGPSSAFTIERFLWELNECKYLPNHIDKVHVHPRAGIITKEHKERESSGVDSTKHIASTMQGGGAFLADKVLRKANVKLARDYDELRDFILTGYMPELITARLMNGETFLHEGSQGWGLDIHHGSDYPNSTSRQTSSAQFIADMGISPRLMGDVIGVFRPYPIRVGNVVENGKTVGYSGGWYPDQREITWNDVAKAAGAPASIAAGELTTVTGRIRRVATFSTLQIKHAVIVNGCNQLFLNFANYVDWNCYGLGGGREAFDKLSPKVHDFIKMVEDEVHVPVTMVGTGPRVDHVIDIR